MKRCAFLLCLCILGCSHSSVVLPVSSATHQATAVAGVVVTPVATKVEPKPFPPELLALAEILSMEIGNDPNLKSQQDNSLHAAHECLMTLKDLKSTDSNITYLIQLTTAATTDVIQSTEKMKSLPQPQSEESALVESVVAGYLGDIRHGMTLGNQIQHAREEIRVEFEKLKSACDRLVTANQLLAKVTEKYAAPAMEQTTKPQVQVEFDETWWGEFDLCRLLNDGPALQNCIIVVDLTGKGGTTRKNVHYIKQWQTGDVLYCPYGHGFMVNGNRVLMSTIENVKQVRVTVYSLEKTLRSTFQYTQEAKEKDFQEYLNRVTFSHRYQPFVKGLVFNDERTMFIQMSGLAWLPKCKVTLTFAKGNQSASWYWEHASWMNDENKSFEASDLKFDPDTVKMAIAVEGFNYVHEVLFKIQP